MAERILLVEDNPDDALLIRRFVESAGAYVVTHSPDFADARKHSLEAFDAILVDFQLQGATAYDIIDWVRASEAGLPVIVVSGTIGEETAVDMVRAGASDYVMKDRLARLPLAIARSISESQARSRHAEAESMLAAIVESAMDGIICIDGARRIVLMNPAARKMFGYGEELIGARLEVLLPDPVKLAHSEHVEHFAQSGISSRRMSTGIVAGRRADGTEFPLEVSISRVARASGLLMTAICRDMSDHVAVQARNDELEKQIIHSQKLEALGTLAGGVAHEINNPLSIAMQYAELITSNPARDKVVTYSANITGALNRIARIVKDILTFSRKDPVDFEDCSVQSIIDVALGLLSHRIKKSGVSIAVQLEPDLPVLRCVPQKLEQALINLVGNALDALAGKEGGRIGIEGRLVEGNVQMVIEDNGPGITPEQIDRVFDPFFTTKGPREGTGLGLSVTHGIVQRHGGRIRAMSMPGQGARFEILLPPASASVSA